MSRPPRPGRRKVAGQEAKATALLCNQTPGLTWRQARWVVRKQMSKTVRDRIKEVAETQAELIVAPYIEAMRNGDYKASDAFLRQYGSLVLDPEREQEAPIGIREQLALLSPEQRADLRRRLEQRTVYELDALDRAHPELAVIEGEVVSQSPLENVEHEDTS